MHRRGFTLVELVVVVAIIAILIGLLLPAVQKVRESAARAASSNNMRQIVLAVQNYASANGDDLPSLEGPSSAPDPGIAPLTLLLPFVEREDAYQACLADPLNPPVIKTYLSPADPTIGGEVKPIFLPPGLPVTPQVGSLTKGLSSYALNAQVFVSPLNFQRTFIDGTSNTIVLAEHYAQNCRGAYFRYTAAGWGRWHIPPIRRATFADGGLYPGRLRYGDLKDIHPQTSGSPPTSIGVRWDSKPVDSTFQVMPQPVHTACRPSQPQTPHPGGMLVGVADGSVRVLQRGISAPTFWASVTPAGGEVLGTDW